MNPPPAAVPVCGRALALRAAGAVTSGCLYALAFPPYSLRFLVILALALLLVSLRGISPRQALGLGFLHGMATYGFGLSWLVHLFGPFSVALWAILALFGALFAWLESQMDALGICGWRRVFWTTVNWASWEFIRAELFPLRFPWFSAGLAIGPNHLLPWIGVYGVGALVACAAAVLYHQTRWVALPAAVFAIALLAHDPLDPPTPGGSGTVTVAAVQAEQQPLETLRDLTLALPEGISHVVWPEYAVPVDLRRFRHDREMLEALCRERGITLTFGTRMEENPEEWRNTALTLGPDGSWLGQHTKVHPVHFFDDGIAGRERLPVATPQGKVGTPICFDCDYQGVIRRMTAAGAEWIAAPTMDAMEWSARQHLQHAELFRIRAAENGRWVVVAASSGPSRILDARGHIHAGLPTMREGSLHGCLKRETRLTFHTRFGWLTPWLLLVIGGVGLMGLIAKNGHAHALPKLGKSGVVPLVFVLLLLVFVLPRAAALPATTLHDGLALTVWETDEELPNNDVHCLHQDRRGYLWAGTAGGLVRFDGLSFRRPDGTDESFFQASTTYAMAEILPGELVFVHDHDAENRLLRLTAHGVKPHPADALLVDGMRAAAVFHQDGGILWILLQDRTWLRWVEGSSVERFPPERRLSTYNQAAILPLEDGRVLLSRGGGLEIYESGKLSRMPKFGTQVVTLHSDREGGAWIVGWQSLHHWSATTGFTEHDIPVDLRAIWPPQLMLNGRGGEIWYSFREAGLWLHDADGSRRVRTSHAIIRCIIEDREGNLWVGTAGGGLNRIRKPEFALWADERPDTIGSICQDAAGTLWLGNSRGIWKLRDGRAHPAGPAEDWPTFAHSLCPTPDGALWVGGSTRIFRYHPDEDPAPREMPPGPVHHAYALFHSQDGGIWAGCEAGPLIRYSLDGSPTLYGPEQGYTGDFAQAFGEDHQGRLWVGTRRGELFRKSGGRFEKIPTPLETSGTGILNLTRGPGEALWLGTRGLGFLRWKEEGFAPVTIDHGLPDGVLAQVLRVEDRLWVGSSNGMFQVALEDLDACADGLMKILRPLRFGRGEGLAGFFATGQRQPCAWKSLDGHLWFVGRKGVVTVDPARIDPVQAPPPVYLDEALTNLGPLPAGGILSGSVRRYEFRFSAPNFSAPDGTRFRYRLRGFDDDWSPPTPQGLAAYRSLPPGQYTFEVAASNRPKIWSFAPARFEFTVQPAWWERLAVRFAAFLGLLAAVTLAARAWANRRLRLKTAALEEERKVERERSRIARDLHDGIGSGLTQIGWLAADLRERPNIPEDLADQSEALERRIRELARDLDAAVWAVSPRHDTLASLCSYLCEFALEHFRRSPIRCRVATPERLPVETLPPQVRNHLFMATREALNNVLKHSAAREVHLVLACQHDSLRIEIRDDGRGFDPASALQGGRNGLQNLRERMREIGGNAEILSLPGEGCRILLHCPLAKS